MTDTDKTPHVIAIVAAIVFNVLDDEDVSTDQTIKESVDIAFKICAQVKDRWDLI